MIKLEIKRNRWDKGNRKKVHMEIMKEMNSNDNVRVRLEEWKESAAIQKRP